jgi:hypothetical protein
MIIRSPYLMLMLLSAIFVGMMFAVVITLQHGQTAPVTVAHAEAERAEKGE